jgi:60 kDa SS-A/Ro ribonucleoprotein
LFTKINIKSEPKKGEYKMSKARYASTVTSKKGRTTTSQTQPIPGREADMKKNSAGGYSFTIDKWTKLHRFLILGNEGGSYYASEKKMTKENATSALACIKEDGKRVVDVVLEILSEGRAPKVDPSLFILALAHNSGDEETKSYIKDNLCNALNIGTHYFDYFNNIKALGGLTSSVQKAFGKIYNGLTPERLAFLLVKYQQRNGVSHRDILRQCHIKPVDDSHDFAFAYAAGKLIPKNLDKNLWERTSVVKSEVVKKGKQKGKYVVEKVTSSIKVKVESFKIIEGFERAKLATSEKEIVSLIEDFRLPQECVPTQFLNKPSVMEALLQHMPITATIRGLGKITATGILKPLSSNTKLIVNRLTNVDNLRKGKVHPLHVLTALYTYNTGHGMKGSLTWEVNKQIVDALDEAFYLSFKAIEPTGKNFYLALDVSGSMGWGNIAGSPFTPRVASVAMAMVTARTEKNYYLKGFSHTLVDVPITAKNTLDDAIRISERIPMGGTDCSLPMLEATRENLEVDTFVVYTDSETWAGKVQPVEALDKYRQKMGRPARLVVCGMLASDFTIADPKDAGMLDCVGFDSATPQIISDFSRGLI